MLHSLPCLSQILKYLSQRNPQLQFLLVQLGDFGTHRYVVGATKPSGYAHRDFGADSLTKKNTGSPFCARGYFSSSESANEASHIVCAAWTTSPGRHGSSTAENTKSIHCGTIRECHLSRSARSTMGRSLRVKWRMDLLVTTACDPFTPWTFRACNILVPLPPFYKASKLEHILIEVHDAIAHLITLIS